VTVKLLKSPRSVPRRRSCPPRSFLDPAGSTHSFTIKLVAFLLRAGVFFCFVRTGKMASISTFSSSALHNIANQLLGVEVARNMALAGFALLVYEYFLTLGDEIEYFWGVPWTVTRILFLTNRYLSLCITTVVIICFYGENLSLEFCGITIRTIFLLDVLASAIVQTIIVTRIWFLFSHKKIVRWGAIVAFALAFCFSLFFVQEFLNGFRPINFRIPGIRKIGCYAKTPANLWRVFFPSFLLHTLLYVCTAIRAVQDRRLLSKSPVLTKLLQDGGFFYFIVFVSVGFTSIGSFLNEDYLIHIPAVHSNLFIVANSVSITRVMLSFQTFANNLGTTEDFLLSNQELSRVNWRAGSRQGEIVVERDTCGYEDDLVGDLEKGGMVTLTRLGVFEEPVLLGPEPSWFS
jgi:hypothetical protein